MKRFAFAALTAIAFLGGAAHTAQADYYCCTEKHKPDYFIDQKFHVIEDAVVFGCDGYHCETNVSLYSGVTVKARCRNGWCEVRSFPFKNAWVLEKCLKPVGYGGYPYPPYKGAKDYHDAPYEGDDPDPRGGYDRAY